MVDYKNIKVVLAVPCQDTIKAKTAFCLVHNVKDVPFEIDFVLRMGCDIIGSRVWLVRNALKYKATHILFVDHDMYFPPDALKRLVDADKDIVGGQYNFRQLPLRSTAIPVGTEPKDGEYRVDPATLPKEPFKCITLGTGLLLIKMSVFEKIPEPWFQFGRSAIGELVQGEDTFFCVQARKAGFDVWAMNVGVKHCGEFLY